MNYLDDKEYYNIIKDIVNHEEFLKRKDFLHHENESVYEHSLKVSYVAYKIAKLLGVDKEKAAIGGLLHDFYYEPWQDKLGKKSPFFKKHGFVHAKEALENSCKYFNKYMDKKTKNIILRHMFPLNIIPPRYIEAWIVTMADKYVSMSVLKHPKAWPKYLGLKPKNNN